MMTFDNGRTATKPLTLSFDAAIEKSHIASFIQSKVYFNHQGPWGVYCSTLELADVPGVVTTFVNGLCKFFSAVKLSEPEWQPVGERNLAVVKRSEYSTYLFDNGRWQLEIQGRCRAGQSLVESMQEVFPEFARNETLERTWLFDWKLVDFSNLPRYVIRYFASSIQRHGIKSITSELSNLVAQWLEALGDTCVRFIRVIPRIRRIYHHGETEFSQSSDHQPWADHIALPRSRISLSFKAA